MNDLILRGYGHLNLVVTRGLMLGKIASIRTELLQFVSKFTGTLPFQSKFRRFVDGI